MKLSIGELAVLIEISSTPRTARYPRGLLESKNDLRRISKRN